MFRFGFGNKLEMSRAWGRAELHPQCLVSIFLRLSLFSSPLLFCATATQGFGIRAFRKWWIPASHVIHPAFGLRYTEVMTFERTASRPAKYNHISFQRSTVAAYGQSLVSRNHGVNRR